MRKCEWRAFFCGIYLQTICCRWRWAAVIIKMRNEEGSLAIYQRFDYELMVRFCFLKLWNKPSTVSGLVFFVLLTYSLYWQIDNSVSLCTVAQADGLCYRLMTPCPKAQPTRNELSYAMKDKYEVSRESLEKKEMLGAGNFGEVWRGVCPFEMELWIQFRIWVILNH